MAGTGEVGASDRTWYYRTWGLFFCALRCHVPQHQRFRLTSPRVRRGQGTGVHASMGHVRVERL